MSRYDKMLEINKKASEQKIEQAKKAIFEPVSYTHLTLPTT